ncbi:STAS domain-containing protein [Chondromyces apiculatus]|uniref:Sensor histidine kinase/response regulator n=1 Tax=Chondromyces apiculatus DSM 436 TaxID=1192034 RepID=A0A017TIL6_9BACT|nr:STAS domain-containing protein [Chondromyces apiculatus]EYF08747.1 sensor histidine kinase/response regulator [Chondromyces apiculatus DSM 436]
MPYPLLPREVRELLDALPEPVALLDAGLTIQYLNEAWRQVTPAEEREAEDGYAEGRAFGGCRSRRLGRGEDDTGLLKAGLHGQRGERRGRVEEADDERWVLTQVAPWLQGDGAGLVVTKRDVTVEHVGARASERYHEVLKSVGFAASQFLGGGVWEERVARALGRFGEATDVSRVYVFDARLSAEGGWICSQKYEWCAPGVKPEIDNPDLQDMPFEALGLGRWVEHLSRDEAVYGLVREFPEGERAVLEPQEIVSLAVVPIFAEGSWWGFIGFDECRVPRAWSEAEIEALRAGAGLLGAALHNERAQALVQEHLAQDEVIRVQKEALRALEAPVIPVHEQVVVMPLVGSLDADRIGRVMEALLEGISTRQPRVAILDMTGVRRLDERGAEGLARTTKAARLLGVEVMLTGIGPEVARALTDRETSLGGIATSLHLQAGIAKALGGGARW